MPPTNNHLSFQLPEAFQTKLSSSSSSAALGYLGEAFCPSAAYSSTDDSAYSRVSQSMQGLKTFLPVLVLTATGLCVPNFLS